MKKIIFTAVALALLLVGSGCTRPSAAVPAAAAPETQPPLARVAAVVTGCGGLVTTADVEKLTGISPIRLLSDLQVVGGGECKFGNEKGDIVFLIGLKPASTFDTSRAQLQGNVRDVAGVGEAAFMFSGYELMAKKGAASVTVATFLSHDKEGAYMTTDQLKAAANFVLGKL